MIRASAALITRPELARFVSYKLLTLIPVSAAVIAMAQHAEGWHWPLLYVGLCLLHAGIMFTIKCPHCPYYRMAGTTHRCFMIWGIPKIRAPRPGPESRLVGVYAPIGVAALTLFPVYWLWFEWELLVLYFLSIAAVLLSIGLNECPRCLNFECPHNVVPEEVREAHLRSLR